MPPGSFLLGLSSSRLCCPWQLAHHHPGSAEPPVRATAEERDHLVRALPVGVTTAASTRCPALWMTSALSLTTPLSPPPQLCPGPPMFPSPGPAWFLEVPPFPTSPGPELRVRLERERSHPHAPPVPWPGAASASGAAQGRPGVLRRRSVA